MPRKQTSPKSQAKRGPVLFAAGGFVLLAVLAIVLTAGGFAFAATQESHDTFCASCHTQPESTFYQRTLSSPVDLASFHKTQDSRCIDCHSGAGLTGRMEAELLGARNALAWYSGTAVQPAKLTQPIRDENCLKCHQEVTLSRRRDNHFHHFLARWQAVDANAATCVSCHPGHTTGGNVQTGFQNQSQTRAVCDACHNVMGEGEEDD